LNPSETRRFAEGTGPAPGGEAAAFADRLFGRLAGFVEGLPILGQYAIAVVLILAIFSADVWTGPELALSIFYLLPISLLGWQRGGRAAFAAVAVCGGAWLLADILSHHVYAHPAIRYWNALVRIGFFIIVAFILTQLRRALEGQQHLARTDGLTGVTNSRRFVEIAAAEIVRMERYGRPLSIAFLDCDNFKQVNDRQGHAAGDSLLRNIGLRIERSLRRTDVVARLGGDEFAVLMPETAATAASKVCEKLRLALADAVDQSGVTFSMGLVTYLEPPVDVEDMLHRADQAMYEVKQSGKDAVRQRIIGAPQPDGMNA
jgi:diguanylate cyclase (GGDEF)-like protein